MMICKVSSYAFTRWWERRQSLEESNWHIERIVPEGVNGMVIFVFARFDIMREMHENLTVLIDCGNSTVIKAKKTHVDGIE